MCGLTSSLPLLYPFLTRVLLRRQVVDVDYHSGNGSLAIHWSDPNIFFASLHMDPAVDYPFCAGFPDQVCGCPPAARACCQSWYCACPCAGRVYCCGEVRVGGYFALP